LLVGICPKTTFGKTRKEMNKRASDAKSGLNLIIINQIRC
jgi:hypothetical protein